MRFAIIEGDVVANITVAEAQFAAEQGWIEATGDVAIGDHYVDGIFVRVEAPPLSLDETRAARLADVDRLAKGKRDTIVADISAAEMASWPIKRAEALAYEESGLDADAPNLAAEASARQVTLADLVAKVLAKADQLAGLEAQIAGHCGYLQDQIRAAADVAAIEAIDITAGWPQ